MENERANRAVRGGENVSDYQGGPKAAKGNHGILEFVVDAFDAWEGLPPSDNDIKEVRKAIDGQVKERLKKLLGLVDKFKPRKGGKGLI